MARVVFELASLTAPPARVRSKHEVYYGSTALLDYLATGGLHSGLGMAQEEQPPVVRIIQTIPHIQV